MGRGQKSKEGLTAKSRLSKIDFFNPKIVTWDLSSKTPTATFRPIKYIDFREGIIPQQERLIRNFPMIFKDSGEPWDLGNLYLQRYFYEAAKTSEPSIKTLHSKAKHLSAYLRWIESMQKVGHNIHDLHFPEDPDDRVTYVYKRYLQNLLRKTPQVIGLSTVKERMSQVIQLYRKALEWGLVEESLIENDPFKEFSVSVRYINSKGIQAIMSAVTTDISFRVSNSQDDDPNVIQDGDNLIPLNLNDQAILLESISNYGNRVFELMAHTALRTGARLQSIATLRISDLRDLSRKKPNKYGEVILSIGAGCLTDLKGEMKYGKRSSLFFPVDLVIELLGYADSDSAKEKRKHSFYGECDENYLFLNTEGRPFYTSHKELKDRSDPSYSKRLSLQDRVDFPIAEGQAINTLMNRLKEFIGAQHPDFRDFKFHDLRATYGMNFMRNWINAGKNPNVGVGQLKVRLGHSSIQTTYQYLNYASEVEEINKLEDDHYAILNGTFPT
ncbi:phage integrase family protein [Marinobacter pelagius]|uniref:Phage integrase family protein n=1 Tax=Marinobacter pelagius TaxID=379482 RepID=A0A366GSZ1_9GAMM|nr:tyrosine-type recombinase/integrase [Marinobacter pelagius]RBP30730.1 phage integrase family protein [Marinobacter pelagius]